MDTAIKHEYSDAAVAHINAQILGLAKEMNVKVSLTGNVSRFGPAKNQAILNGRFVGFYADKAFGGNGTEGWQLGSARIKGNRAQAAHFVSTGELPVDGEAAPRKALPSNKNAADQAPASAPSQPSADPVMARLELIKTLKAAGISDELIALALK